MIDKRISKEQRSAYFSAEKRTYAHPIFKVYGKLNRITQGTGGDVGDAGNQNMAMSDRRVKENIVRIGTHPLGVGLYLFDYKPEFRKQVADNRQFGLMADEVENVMPQAVTVGSDGYKRVNYGMLGIELNS